MSIDLMMICKVFSEGMNTKLYKNNDTIILCFKQQYLLIFGLQTVDEWATKQLTCKQVIQALLLVE